MGAWTEIVDFTFTANETSRTFSGLNITKDDFIKVVMTQVNAGGSTSLVSCYPNTTASVSGFNTTTNYHSQILLGSGTSTSALRVNGNEFSIANSSNQNYSTGFFKLSENGKANIFVNIHRFLDSGLENRFIYITSSNLTFNDPITSLTFTSTVTSGLGTGSRIQIYRLDVKKVADITVTSNSTQVDIPVTGSLDPAITKDSEYLLVSDREGTSSLECFPNDLTTSTNYHTQHILGSGSSSSAARGNNSRISGFTSSLTRTITYTHIKLSEIGAYTTQSYSLGALGTSTLVVINHFASSTSEAITSITKLNIISSVSNEIRSGSRFILYKLK